MSRFPIHMATILAAVVVCVGPAAAVGSENTCADHDPFTAELEDQIVSRYPSQRFSAAVYDQRTGCEYHLSPEERITTASVFKIEVMAAVLLRAQEAGREVSDREMALLVPMITESSNPPTNRLFTELGGPSGFAAVHRRFGLTETTVPGWKWGATVTSAADQVHLARQVLLGEFGPLDEDSIATAWGLMTAVAPSQRWGVTAGVPRRLPVALKNGFYPRSGEGWRINSVGVIEDLSGGAYVTAILSTGWKTEAEGIRAVEEIAAAVNRMLLPLSGPDGLPPAHDSSVDTHAPAVLWSQRIRIR